MRIEKGARIVGGTDPDLIEVAEARARFEVWRGLSSGLEPEEIRRTVLGRFLDEISAESYGHYADESLMAAMQRAVEAALVEG
jgi:hypothetical protein